MTTSALAIVMGLIGAVGFGGGGPPAHAAAPDPGSYVWPVVGPVIRGFEVPNGQFGAGHRGIDIAAPFGSEMVAAQDGVVAFAGWVAGALFVSIDHPDGLRSTYSWLESASVSGGQAVTQGEPIGTTGHGHPEALVPHLHFGVRDGDTYLDPLSLLEPGSVAGLIHLAPLDGGTRAAPFTGGTQRPGFPGLEVGVSEGPGEPRSLVAGATPR